MESGGEVGVEQGMDGPLRATAGTLQSRQDEKRASWEEGGAFRIVGIKDYSGAKQQDNSRDAISYPHNAEPTPTMTTKIM